MKINKWLNRFQRLKANPLHFIKEFYYHKLSRTGRKRHSQDMKDFFNEMVNFIAYYNVNSLKVGSEYIWPYIRSHIWININFVSTGKAKRKYLNPIFVQNAHNKQVHINLRLKLKYLCDAYEIDELDDEKSDFLFFINTNGAEEITVDSKIYHRIIDPFYEAAQKLGKAQKLEIVKSANINPLKWQRYYHKSKLIFLKYEDISSYTDQFTYEKNIFSLIKQHIPSIVLHNKAQLNSVVNYELHIRKQYIDLLKKTKPKVICLHGFHYQAPLISAADELGILTVDLQHGLQVGWNPLYNNYDEMPTAGYQALPDYYAVWGKKEYNNILKTFRSSKHKPIYMGNPWLEKIEEFLTPLSAHIVENISQFDTKILIIMQNQTKIPELFLEIIENTNDDILWIIRHHPKGERYKARDFSKRKNILIDDEIDSTLFNELFKYVDIAISEGSTLALEASHYGVHNIITSKMGLENYHDEIDSGAFHHLSDASEFEGIMNKTRGVQKQDRLHAFEDIDTKDFLQKLLRVSEDKQTKDDPLSTSLLPPNDLKEDIEKQIELISLEIDTGNTDDSVKSFYKLRKLLSSTPSIPFLYEREQNIWIKEAKIFQRHINNSMKNNNTNIVMISDSLNLPQPYEIDSDSFGIEHTSTYMFNTNQSSFSMRTWAQRFLTTQKLLDNWSLMTEGLKDKHLIIHLGIIDSEERIFLEEQRLALQTYPENIGNIVGEYGIEYRKEIIKNQKSLSYVSLDNFRENIKDIVLKSKNEGVASLTFINIITFPKSHEKDTPGSLENTKRFNKVFEDTQKMFPLINIIDLDSLVKENGFIDCMLEDNTHLSHQGHKLLADKILSTLSKIEKKE